MNSARRSLPELPLLDAFRQVVHDGVGSWAAALVERALSDEAAAASGQGQEDSPRLTRPIQHARQSLTHALTHALTQTLGDALRAPGDAPQAQPAATPAVTANADVAQPRGRPTLTPESQIDDAIETALLLQLIESEAALELKTLAGLCSGLHALDRLDLSVVPLRPLACARALRDAAHQAAPDGALQPVLLRGLGTAMAAQMREVYGELAGWLQQQGVKPVDAPSAPRRPAPPARKPLAREEAPLPPAESMRELLAWARRNHRLANRPAAQPPAPARQPEAPAAELALQEEIEIVEVPEIDDPAPQVPAATAEDLMHRLFSELRRQTAGSTSMRGLLVPLELLGQSVAADAPEVWSNPDHAWWQLLDRLLAAAVVHDDLRTADQHILGQSLEGILQQMLACPLLDEPIFKRSADMVQRLVAQLLERSASPAAEDVAALQHGAERADLEHTFRRQLAQRLQTAPAGAVMRRFLLEVWTEVMVAQALRHGATAPAVAAAAGVVDDLIQLTAPRGPAFSRAQMVSLLRRVKEGLADAGLPRPRIDAELKQLGELLRDPPRQDPSPPPPVAARGPAWAAPFASPDRPAERPRVSDGQAQGAAARAPVSASVIPKRSPKPTPKPAPEPTPEQWASALQPGTAHRLFLQGVWMTARLNWVGPGQRLFLFQSRHGGRSHTLTLRMLCKLREAGLAMPIEDNLLRAQAMESLVRDHVA